MFTLSLNLPIVCFFHLIIHAFFKSIIFLCVGSLIFVRGGVQDYRLIGRVWRQSPVIFSWFIVCCLCLTGVPFVSGFFSKHLILERIMLNSFNYFSRIFIYISVILTGAYCGRLLLDIVIKETFFPRRGEVDWNKFCIVPVRVLGMGAVGIGHVFSNYFAMFYINRAYLNWYESLFFLIVFSDICWVVKFIYGDSAAQPEEFGKRNQGNLQDFFIFCNKLGFLSELSGNWLRRLFLKKFFVLNIVVEKRWCNFIWNKGLYNSFSSVKVVLRKRLFKVVGSSILFGLCLLLVLV